MVVVKYVVLSLLAALAIAAPYPVEQVKDSYQTTDVANLGLVENQVPAKGKGNGPPKIPKSGGGAGGVGGAGGAPPKSFPPAKPMGGMSPNSGGGLPKASAGQGGFPKSSGGEGGSMRKARDSVGSSAPLPPPAPIPAFEPASAPAPEVALAMDLNAARGTEVSSHARL